LLVLAMNARTRKLVGTVVLLLFLAAYVGLVAAVGMGRVADSGPLVTLGYALAAGLAWVLPAGFLIRWMQRPDVAPTLTPRRAAESGPPGRMERRKDKAPYK
jgi:hypothetical protein